MGRKRGRFQGLKNVLRFNYQMYLGAIAACTALLVMALRTSGFFHTLLSVAVSILVLQVLLSLLATLLAYDWSALYDLNFLPEQLPGHFRILNINAGFDECSEILAWRYPRSVIQVYDFYDPRKHTEASIRRARAAYPPVPGTNQMTTRLPEAGDTADLICVILAAHEIRDVAERRSLLAELRRVSKPGGKIVIVEHLRDLPNLIAYNLGALHFFPLHQWHSDFAAAGLKISTSNSLNPFIHCWTLSPN